MSDKLTSKSDKVDINHVLDINQVLKEHQKPIVIEFDTHQKACLDMREDLARFEKVFGGKVTFLHVDAHDAKNENLVKSHEISNSIPAVDYIDSQKGKVVFKQRGVLPEELNDQNMDNIAKGLAKIMGTSEEQVFKDVIKYEELYNSTFQVPFIKSDFLLQGQ